MKQALLLWAAATLLFSLSLPTPVSSNAGLFTYYETPLFPRLGNSGMVMAKEPAVGVGPSQWPNIFFPPQLIPTGNQCGGLGQSTGYGQSPIVIPKAARDECDVGLQGYEFEGGDCDWKDLWFRTVANGVIVNSTTPECSLGRMKIPGMDNWFNLLQFHIHTSSEHSVDGQYYPAELHMVHQESNGASFAVFGMFVDQNESESEEHPVFESFLQGWEAAGKSEALSLFPFLHFSPKDDVLHLILALSSLHVIKLFLTNSTHTALQTEEYCAVNPEGTGVWGPNSAFESRQMRLICPAVGEGIDASQVTIDESTGMPPLKHPEYPVSDEDGSTKFANVYEALPTPGYGIYSYRGGLTTPPCTEIVNWNLLDTPMYISRNQMDRLYQRILCFAEPSTCRHATIANEAGHTNRPVQALQGRTVTHRCPSNQTDNTNEIIRDPVPPTYEYVETQVRRCILGSEIGGPLQMCWQGEYFAHFSLIYPSVVLALGISVFYLLSRFCGWLPYTAVMFFLGMVMGIFSVVSDSADQFTGAVRMWEAIGAETLLLAFLPGLLFRDAYASNVFLFQKAFWQCVVMAFPMVLVGTGLTACVGYFVLPYGWSWNLACTFGAILSATDPVAVAALCKSSVVGFI